MTIFLFSGLILFFSFLAGILGALTGLGGGVIIIPTLVLLFHVNIHYAMGASLISVMATSSGSAAAYLREGYTNLRIGMFLETAAVAGAFTGALMTIIVSKLFLTLVFCLVLFLSAYLTISRQEEHESYEGSHPWAKAFKLQGTHPTKNGLESYHVQNVPFALFIMGLAGIIAGLLGVGSGTLKVLAMDQAMRLPYKVSTTTSNFMIGITAAVSAGIYFAQGFIDPGIAFPVMLGVLAGSFSGAKLLTKIHNRWLRIIFSLAICAVGIQMLYNTFAGTI